MNGQDLVWINDFSYRVRGITVPEINWSSLPASHQFELIIFALRHTEKCAILCLMASISFLKFKIVCRYGSVHGARVNQIGLINVWEQAYNILLLICINNNVR